MLIFIPDICQKELRLKPFGNANDKHQLRTPSKSYKIVFITLTSLYKKPEDQYRYRNN